MKKQSKETSSVPCLMVSALALLSFIAPLKFANPVVIREQPFASQTSSEWVLNLIFSGWPNSWFYITIFGLSLYGVSRWLREKDRVRFNPYVLWIPLIFLLSQFLSAVGTLHADLTKVVLLLLVSVVAGFYLGAAFIRHENHLQWILLGWCAASLLVVTSGMEQAFGGLEQTRRFYLEHPEFSNPELWKKLQSNRIFATLVYPNALGGFIISAVFLVGAYTIHMARTYPKLKNVAQSLGIVLICLLFFCLWKSQSKGAYVCLFLTVLLGLTLLIQGKRLVWVGLAASLIFVVVFAVGYGKQAIERAKKSGEARTAYWKAALEIGKEYPWLGSGPGTFSVMYPKYKNAEDEETRLVHNNYLQMWSDSGAMGFILFALWLPGMLVLSWMKLKRGAEISIIRSLVWCACAAFALHSLIDFDLYMVSNSWPIFVLLGSLASPSTLP